MHTHITHAIAKPLPDLERPLRYRLTSINGNHPQWGLNGYAWILSGDQKHKCNATKCRLHRHRPRALQYCASWCGGRARTHTHNTHTDTHHTRCGSQIWTFEKQEVSNVPDEQRSINPLRVATPDTMCLLSRIAYSPQMF